MRYTHTVFPYRFALFGTQLVTWSHERLRMFGEGLQGFVQQTQRTQLFISLYSASVIMFCMTRFAMTQYKDEFRQVAMPMLLFGVCVAVMMAHCWKARGLLRISWTGIFIVLMYSTLQESHQQFLSPHTILLYGCILALAGLTSSFKETLIMCGVIIALTLLRTWFFCAYTYSFLLHILWLHNFTPIESMSSGLLLIGMTTQSFRQSKERNNERMKLLHEHLQVSLLQSATLQEFHQQSIQTEKSRYMQLYKFASIGRITSGLMHDLVNAIQGSHLVLTRVLEQGAGQQDLHYLLIGIRHTLSIIESTKHHLMNQESPTWFSPIQEIQRAQLILQHKTYMHGVKITYHYVHAMKILGDRIRFYQTIQNMLSNALDALGDQHTDTEKSIHIELSHQPHGYIISISDNGPGLQAGTESLVFQPFFTTKTQSGGTGIGLSLVKEYIEQSFNGTITFTTSPSGTTFFITIPLERVHERKTSPKKLQ